MKLRMPLTDLSVSKVSSSKWTIQSFSPRMLTSSSRQYCSARDLFRHPDLLLYDDGTTVSRTLVLKPKPQPHYLKSKYLNICIKVLTFHINRHIGDDFNNEILESNRGQSFQIFCNCLFDQFRVQTTCDHSDTNKGSQKWRTLNNDLLCKCPESNESNQIEESLRQTKKAQNTNQVQKNCLKVSIFGPWVYQIYRVALAVSTQIYFK